MTDETATATDLEPTPAEAEPFRAIGDATYSPDDNKLRLYPFARLAKETYDRVKAAGFSWAPKQELFVAGMWTPQREDLLLELCGEIGDEDTSLVERAEDRAERFEGYSERRGAEAESAKAAVDAIADGIPFGQPILVGHHSERRARKDKERIESGMRKAVTLWRRSGYWADRAKGALHHAKYKELPAVRARRIKTIEADKRKQERYVAEAEAAIRLWTDPTKELTHARARAIANHCHVSRCFPLTDYPREYPASQYEGAMCLWSALGDEPEMAIITPEQAREIAVGCHRRTIEWAGRWVEHYENRLSYERAMLGEQGGTVADRTKPEKGGAVRCWCSPGHGKGWSYVKRVNKVSVTVEDNWGNGGKNFTRTIEFDKITAVMSAAEVAAAKAEGRLAETAFKDGFFVADRAETDAEANLREHRERMEARKAEEAKSAPFDAMAETLRAGGVKTVVAPTLFPTPEALAKRVIDLAEVEPGHRVLEPSAGTGNLLRPLGPLGRYQAVAVELNYDLADQLCRTWVSCLPVHQCDFLTTTPEALGGEFDRVVMNPPFDKGSDIRHVEHALTMLKPGGRLVAVVANGPRQQERLQPLATAWIDLPEGSFAAQGTNVRTAIVVIDRDEPEPATARQGDSRTACLFAD